MGFTDLLNDAGGFGRFQIIHVVLLSIPSLLMASQNLLNNFTAGVPRHYCKIPNVTALAGASNNSVTEQNIVSLLPAFIPLEENFCTHSSVHTCWDLVCSLRPMKQLCQTIYMGGVLTGAILFGGLSDRFGRKVMLLWSYFQLAVLGTFTSLSTSYLAYCIFRFLTGMSVSGVILNAFSLKVEWIPTRHRTMVGTMSSIVFTFGQVILAAVAYSLKDWRLLHVAVCSPFFLVFLYSWWYSESARWLLLVDRPEEALRHLQRVARINGRPEMSHMQNEMQSPRTDRTAYDLLRTPVMRRISMCLLVVWFSTSFAYYGLAMDLQKFGVNIYLMQVIFGAVDFPAKLGVLAMLSFLGRRVSQAMCLLASASLINHIDHLTDMQIIRTTLAVLGKAFTSASFTCVYLYTGELYPTVIRQTGMGFCSTMARVGSMAAPAFLILDEVFPALPSVVYGGSSLFAGIVAFMLPETISTPLPDTIEDVEKKNAPFNLFKSPGNIL
uniref:Solute carrier family 22 member 6 n=1 Tax=Electrophorus electricus TaxID=8005 RepID=A0A4W4FTW5_ELEEL